MSFVFVLVSILFAGTATQSDWSGGGGVQGPLSDWSNAFWNSDVGIGFGDGKLLLSYYPIAPIEHTVDGDFIGATSVFAADVDGDGDADILGTAYNDDDISWWENTDGTGTSWTEHTVDGDFNGAYSVYSTDLDIDGDADILGAANSNGDITWWENADGTGTIWIEHVIGSSFFGANTVFSHDIDGDGDADVLGSAGNADDIAWWENTDGTGTSWAKHGVDNNFDGARSVYSTDVDGDGDADILGAAWWAHEITWWENIDGTGTSWIEHTVDGNFYGANSIYSIDVDNDGDADILGAARNADEIAWWENIDGTGTSWTKHTIDENFDGAHSVYSTDLDGDGDSDVLGAAWEANDISWWENIDGVGTSWTEHTIDAEFDEAYSVFASDVDGDGAADILGAARDANDIAWWEAMGYSPLGALESSILDAGDIGEWSIFLSTPQAPSGTSVCFQFRSSDDSSNMGAWSDTVFSPDTPLAGILADSTRYLQYKIILETSDSSVSPELHEVAFSFTLITGAEENESGEVSSWSLSVSENPSDGFFSAQVSVPEAGSIKLSLYDVSGRVVAQTSQEFPAGSHSINFAELAQGVYFCTMRAGDFAATDRIVVID